MIQRSVFFISMLFILACNNDKEKEIETTEEKPAAKSSNTVADTRTAETAVANATISYIVEGKHFSQKASILVQKDKSKLSPGNNLFGIITADGSKAMTFNVNFLFTPKPGSYPIVGLSLSREVPSAVPQTFGSILGGKPKMTNYTVGLTQVENLGPNKAGGTRWKIGGTVSDEVTILAAPIMKLEKTHPASINVTKIKFSNLEFDDNWEEMLEESMKKIKN